MIFSSSSFSRWPTFILLDRVGFEADQFAAGLVDGVDLLLQPARAGRIPHHRHHLHHLPGRVDHRRGDHLHELLVFDIQRVAFGAVEAGGRVGVLRGDLLAESSNASWQVRRIFSCTRGGQACIFLFIQLQRPSPSTMQTPSPIVLRIRLACWLNQGAFEGKEIGGIGEDGGEMIVAEGFDRLVDGGDLHDVAAGPQGVDRGNIGLGLTGQNENFIAIARPSFVTRLLQSAQPS